MTNQLIEKQEPLSPETKVFSDSKKEVTAQKDISKMKDLADLGQTLFSFPEASRICLRAALASNRSEVHINEAQALRKETEKNPNLTDSQKKERTAFGYDLEIAGLQEKFVKTKNNKEKEEIKNDIKKLVAEKKQKTGIEKNQLDDFARFFKLNDEIGEIIELHIGNGTPMAAINLILERAAINKEARQVLLENFKQSGVLTDEQIKETEKCLDNLGRKKQMEKGAKVAGKVGLGALAAMLLMTYMSSKEKS